MKKSTILIFASAFCMITLLTGNGICGTINTKTWNQNFVTDSYYTHPSIAANKYLAVVAMVNISGNNEISVWGEPRGDWDARSNSHWTNNGYTPGSEAHPKDHQIDVAMNDTYVVVVYRGGDDGFHILTGEIKYNVTGVAKKAIGIKWKDPVEYPGDEGASNHSFVAIDKFNNILFTPYQGGDWTRIESAIINSSGDFELNNHFCEAFNAMIPDICFMPNGYANFISASKNYGKFAVIKPDYKNDQINELYHPVVIYRFKSGTYLKGFDQASICAAPELGNNYCWAAVNWGIGTYLYKLEYLEDGKIRHWLKDKTLSDCAVEERIAYADGYVFVAYADPGVNLVKVQIYDSSNLAGNSGRSITSTQPDSNGDYYILLNDRSVILKINVKNQEIKDYYVLPFSYLNGISVISNQIDGLFAVYQKGSNVGDQDHLEFLKDGDVKSIKTDIVENSEYIVGKPSMIIKKDSDTTDLVDGILCFNYSDNHIHTVPFTYDTVNNEIKIGKTHTAISPTGQNAVLCWLPNNNEFAMFCNGPDNRVVYSRIGTFTDSCDRGVITWHDHFSTYFDYQMILCPSVYCTGNKIYFVHRNADNVLQVNMAYTNPINDYFYFDFLVKILPNTENCRNPVLLNDEYISYMNSDGEVETVNLADSQETGMQI